MVVSFKHLAELLAPPPAPSFAELASLLTRFSTKGLKLRLTIDVALAGGISEQEMQEVRAALKDLGLSDALGKSGGGTT